MIVAVAALRTELLFVRGMRRIAVGVGPRSRKRLAGALEKFRVRGAVILGFCGATHARLVPGTLVLANRVRHGDESLGLAGELVTAARERLPGAEVGPLATADGIADAVEKARLSLDAVAVDMESYHLAAELSQRGIPYLVVRCVLDPLWEDATRHSKLTLAGRALTCARRLGQAVRTLYPIFMEVR